MHSNKKRACAFSIAALEAPESGVGVTYHASFNASKSGKDIWQVLAATGKLGNNGNVPIVVALYERDFNASTCDVQPI